jgi:predicted nucleotidyltransferase
MYICENCGKIIEEVPFDYEYWNLSDGFNNAKKIIHEQDCSCGGSYEKAKECEICGDYIKESGIDICEKCLEDYKTLDIVLEIGADYEEALSLNGFLASAFTKEEIELILIDTLNNNEKERMDKAIKKYINDDVDYFGRHVEKKWKEGR